MTVDRDEPLARQLEPFLDQLYGASGAGRWDVERPRFAAALLASVRHAFREPAESRALARYLDSINLPDLALSCACADGRDHAWNHFITEFRPRLYAAATAIAGADGRELADSLYGELFGIETREGRRRSLFEYYHGRSSLLTWLRAVLAQRHVDRSRVASRLRPLDDVAEPTASDSAPDPDRERYVSLLQRALTSALGALGTTDRLRLSYYYLQDLRMAEIGRLLGESEATVSRKLERTRRAIRQDVEHRLRHDERLSDLQVRRCFEYATDPWQLDVSAALQGRDP
jgi:RNA polymerase sigma-70 factor (ECF subfamily)